MAAPSSTSSPRVACAKWLTRALFPKVVEFKVISREREKHEFMPVVYLIERSATWKKRVPRTVERQLVEEYIAPLLALDKDNATRIGFAKDELQRIGEELRARTELLACAGTDESSYKLGLLVEYAPLPSLHKSELFQVVHQLLATLAAAPHQRALLVPVSLHFCADGGVLMTRRYAGLRYGAPVLVEARDVAIFQEDPLEFVQHVSAKLTASLKMQPPQTAAQMEILRLSRSLHVYCANVYRDDCFSRRQIASMNEEILQIHFRTRNHPDMHALKAKMQQYCARLKKWRLRDEDINAATVSAAIPKNGMQVACIVASILLRFATTPWRLLVSGASDLVFRAQQQQRKMLALTAVVAALAKCGLAFVLFGVLCRLALAGDRHWLSLAVLLLVVVLHSASSALGCEDVAAHWKKAQFYIMDASELRELKEMRLLLARSIHAIVAQYVSTDLPPPVLQQGRGAAQQGAVKPQPDQFSLNPHHKIFINAPRSFPLDFADGVASTGVARRAVYAPKMLRDETWRNIYGSLAPPHLQFAALLADNKGDALPMERLLETPFFNAVLSAYVLHQKNRSRSPSETDSDAGWLDDMIATSEAVSLADVAALGAFASVRDVIEASLELAEEEEELSS